MIKFIFVVLFLGEGGGGVKKVYLNNVKVK